MNPKEKILQFLKTDNAKIVFIRDIIVALLAVLIVLILLWSYTGQWFQAPMVAIESGSMEHPDNPPFGRLGTIDAGDMVLVQRVYTLDDIITHGGNLGGAQAENGWRSYGDYGDVLIYKPLGRDDTPQIIHRAMCWVDVNKGDEVHPLYRCRLVAKETKRDKRDDLFAATPPHEAKIMLFSLAVTEGIGYERMDISKIA